MEKDLKVWSYWEGHKPEYIKVCIATLKRLCSDFTLLSPDNINEYITDSGLKLSKLHYLNSPAHRADVYRVAVIERHGGLWVDCDTVMIDSTASFTRYVSDYKEAFFYSRWDDGRVLNGYFYATKEHPLMSEWLHQINKTMGTSKYNWTAFGEKILTPLVNSGRFNTVKMDRRIFLPLNIDKVPWMFFEPVHWECFINRSSIAFGLNNSWFKDHVSHFYNSQFPWVGDTLISQLLNDVRSNDY